MQTERNGSTQKTRGGTHQRNGGTQKERQSTSESLSVWSSQKRIEEGHTELISIL